jgi:hypothetical protein
MNGIRLILGIGNGFSNLNNQAKAVIHRLPTGMPLHHPNGEYPGVEKGAELGA